MKTTGRGVALAALVVVVDQVTKHWALSALADGRTIDVVWTLRFALGFNSGFAFSTGSGWGPWIGVAAIGVVAAMSVAMHRADSPLARAALALIVGGAVGNIVDRVFREGGRLSGRVVDFIDLQWWPVFNVADSAITVGAVLLVVASLLAPSGVGAEGPGDAARSDTAGGDA